MALIYELLGRTLTAPVENPELTRGIDKTYRH